MWRAKAGKQGRNNGTLYAGTGLLSLGTGTFITDSITYHIRERALRMRDEDLLEVEYDGGLSQLFGQYWLRWFCPMVPKAPKASSRERTWSVTKSRAP